MEKVLLDTDIGSDIDDALALAYLLCEPQCDLLGVTTVTGEADLRAEMASAICNHLGRPDIPIHVGVEQTMLRKQQQPKAPQAAKLGDWPRKKFSKVPTAVEFLRETIRKNPGEITLLTIGPLTNIGLLFALDPEIPSLLKRIVLMCGRFFDGVPREWNAIGDPEATAIVYGDGHRTPMPPEHRSIGLDVTMKVSIHRDKARPKFAAIKALEPVRDFAEVWFSMAEYAVFHDPLAAVSIFHPDVCTYVDADVEISRNDPTAGWIVPKLWGDDLVPRFKLAKDVNADKFFDIYFSTLENGNPQKS